MMSRHVSLGDTPRDNPGDTPRESLRLSLRLSHRTRTRTRNNPLQLLTCKTTSDDPNRAGVGFASTYAPAKRKDFPPR